LSTLFAEVHFFNLLRPHDFREMQRRWLRAPLTTHREDSTVSDAFILHSRFNYSNGECQCIQGKGAVIGLNPN
jgi:hypothetical protein